MNPPRILAATTLVLAALLAGCENPPSKETSGTALGAVVGGLIGSGIGEGSGRTAAIIAGAVAGGLIGKSIGRNMDDTDRMKTAQALETSPTNTPTSWKNPDTGNQYTVVPTHTYTTAQGMPCREYVMDTTIDGRPEQVRGTACRQGDGSWKVQN
jgi:surface antigen